MGKLGKWGGKRWGAEERMKAKPSVSCGEVRDLGRGVVGARESKEWGAENVQGYFIQLSGSGGKLPSECCCSWMATVCIFTVVETCLIEHIWLTWSSLCEPVAACVMVRSAMLLNTRDGQTLAQASEWRTLTHCLWSQTALCHWGPVWAQAFPTAPLSAWWLQQSHSAGRCHWRSPRGERRVINPPWQLILPRLVSSTLYHFQRCQICKYSTWNFTAHTWKK